VSICGAAGLLREAERVGRTRVSGR